MKKMLKLLSAVLVTALIATAVSVSVIAAEPASISVKTAPTRTVYYDGVDTFEGMLMCDPSGMVVTVTNQDGTTFDVSADDGEIFMDVEKYVIGENEAIVYYLPEEGDPLTATLPITVKENPVVSVKITKMPGKTEYDMDKDVLTADNFDLDKVYASDPETFDAILEELGMTFEDLKEAYSDPEMMNLFKQLMFSEYDAILLVDTTGMEIEVAFKDGTTQTLTDEQDGALYNGTEIPVTVGQPKTIKEGVNTLYIDVAGVQANFDVTVKKNGASSEKPSVTPEKPTAKPDNSKNPVIPDTDGGVSLTAAAVVAVVSGFGIALVPSKKKEQF